MDALDRHGDFEYRLLDRERRAISKRSAVDSANSGGTCAECGGRIHPERLQALPGARNCIDCQREIEREAA